MRRLLVTLAVVLLGSLLGAPAAAAKGDLRATLLAPQALRFATPGTPIAISWTMSSVHDGARETFGAGGLFVDLTSDRGGRSSRGWAEGANGRYIARLLVSEGGIGAIRIGLQGWRYDGRGPAAGRGTAAPLRVAIENDPFAVAAHAESGSQNASDDGLPAWSAIAAMLAALAAALLARRALTVRRAVA